MIDSPEEIANIIAPSVQDYLVKNKEDIIARSLFGPVDRMAARFAYPQFVAMSPMIVKEVVRDVLNKLGNS